MAKINRAYLKKWFYPILASGVVGWCVGSGTIAGLSVIAANDVNLLSWYNIWIVVKAWLISSTLGFIGAFVTALAKSPLDIHQVLVEAPEGSTVKVEVKAESPGKE